MGDITMPRVKTKWTDGLIRKCCDLIMAGNSQDEVSKQTGQDWSNIAQQLNRRGISTRYLREKGGHPPDFTGGRSSHK